MTLDVPTIPVPQRPIYDDALTGLRRSPKTIPPKYFYDDRGSRLFSQICEVPEYYPTRTEALLTRENISDIAALIGSHCQLVELGTGDGFKTRLLLQHLHDLAAYIPVEISRTQLDRCVGELSAEFPDLEILPLCTDYTGDFQVPKNGCEGRTTFYFPGSTIGNFHPSEAGNFLYKIAQKAGPRGGLLVGVDLVKDRTILEAAYNDCAGVTAEFNLNLLRRLNRECGANFDLNTFRHRAVYQSEKHRIEMQLVSTCDQRVDFPTESFHFRKGEAIVTEHSYKFTIDRFATLAEEASWRTRAIWTDDRQLFSVWYLERREKN